MRPERTPSASSADEASGRTTRTESAGTGAGCAGAAWAWASDAGIAAAIAVAVVRAAIHAAPCVVRLRMGAS
jgi:hypothetical protein